MTSPGFFSKKTMIRKLQKEISNTLEQLSVSETFRHLFFSGEKLFKSGEVQILAQGKDFFEVSVSDTFDDFVVSYRFKEKPAGDCSCKAPDWCSHRVAGILQIEEKLNSLKPHTNEEGKAYTREGMIKRVLAERRERAAKAQYRLVPADNVYGEHRLITQQETSYKITFRDFEKKSGYCSCSDFATNKLGTCKHLMYAFDHFELKNSDQAYPFVEIFLDPLNDYLISWYYPQPPPAPVEALIRLYFGSERHISPQRTMMFFGFVKEAAKQKQILVRQEVLDKIEREFDRHILEQKQESTRLNYSLIRADLYPYQKQGIAFATFRKGVIIADEMGLGKTLQAIGAAVFKKKIFGFKKTLIICPASLKAQWKGEIEKFTNENVELVEGPPAQRAKSYMRPDAYFLIITYETVLRDVQAINKAGVDFIILDEAQRIKNFETLTANAIKSLRKNHSLVITGTPIENKLADIYSITGFIDPGLLAPLWEFSYRHCYFDLQNENRITGYYNLQDLKEKLTQVLIRREKKEVLDQLSSITIIDVPVEMHPVQADYHASYARTISTILSKKFKTPYDWQMLTKNLQSMRMVCDSTFLVDKDTEHSPKLLELEEILLEKLDINNNKRKIIIFSEWTVMLAIISRMLAKNGIGFTELTGNVSVKERKKMIREFEENPYCRIFLSSESGGTGLNLQVADTVINFELPWSPSKKNQRIGRIDRLGQKSRNLTVINLIMRNSIEMKVLSGLGLKQDLFDSVLNSDNLTDEVDFSEKGRAQFLQLLEESMGEFTTDRVESDTEEPIEEPEIPQTDIPEEDSTRLAELEAIMNKGMEFLSGLYKLSTGKELNPAGNRIAIDKETGEVVMRFKVDL